MKKSIESRIEEIRNIYIQFQDHGISDEIIKEFKIIANDFVKNGHGASGKIDLKEISMLLSYVLSTQDHIVSFVKLQKTT